MDASAPDEPSNWASEASNSSKGKRKNSSSSLGSLTQPKVSLVPPKLAVKALEKPPRSPSHSSLAAENLSPRPPTLALKAWEKPPRSPSQSGLAAQNLSPRPSSPALSPRPSTPQLSPRPSAPTHSPRQSSPATAAPPRPSGQRSGSKLKVASSAAEEASKRKGSHTKRLSQSDDANAGIKRLRAFLKKQFGGPDEAFAAFDRFGAGKITYGDLQAGFEHLNISPWDATGGIDMLQVFKELDYNESMDLSYFKLMECDAATRLRKKSKLQPKGKAKKKKAAAAGEEKAESEQLPRRLWVFEAPKEKGQWPPKTWVATESEWIRKIAAFGEDLSTDILNLEYGFIGKRGVAQLVEAINTMPGMRIMTELQLFGNYISSLGVMPLAGALEQKVSLRRLNLGKNGIGDDGAARLAETVLKIDVLEELLLASNRVSDRGAAELASAISKGPPALQTLDLSDNSICEEGMKAFLDAFEVCRISDLRLEGNIAEVPVFPDPPVEEEPAPEELYGPPIPAAQKSAPSSPPPPPGAGPRAQTPPGVPRAATPQGGPRAQTPQPGSRKALAAARDARLALYGPPGTSPWTCDIAHKLKPRARKGQKLPTQTVKVSGLKSPELRLAALAGSYVPGSVADAWPAGMSLAKALEDATLLGTGKLARPASQGSMAEAGHRRPGDEELFGDDPWMRSDGLTKHRNFGGSGAELQQKFGRVHTIRMQT